MSKKILIAGDSWGIGEYQGSGADYTPTGRGLESIFKEQDYTVTNISRAGCSNSDIIDNLKAISMKDFDAVLFLQTDAFREHTHHGKYNNEPNWRIISNEFIDSLLQYNSLADYFDQYYNDLYTELSSLGKEIFCIGAWSMLHPSIINYERLVPAVTSATSLILNKLIVDCYVSDFEYFIQFDKHKPFMDKFGQEFKQLTLESLEKFDLICREWNDVHPTYKGYQLLADHLVKLF